MRLGKLSVSYRFHTSKTKLSMVSVTAFEDVNVLRAFKDNDCLEKVMVNMWRFISRDFDVVAKEYGKVS